MWEGKLRRRNNEFRNNDFTGARFLTTSFRCGVPLHAQRFPENVIVSEDGHAALERFEAAVKDLGDEAPQILVGWVRAWRLALADGQTEAFFIPDDLPPMAPEARQRIISAVEGE